jgi:hypothetical protein
MGIQSPFFFDKGYRYYVNAHYKISRKLSLWTRFSQTLYPYKTIIGSALYEIMGIKKSEIKFQMIYDF